MTPGGCSGIREDNAGGFVPMNNYGYTSFVNDYVFLEQVGRNVAEFGRDIQEKKLSGHEQGFRDRSGNLGRGGKSRGHKGALSRGKGHTKRDTLRDVLLERADIDMQLCPEGMERKKMNQSSWDTKSNTGYLTLQYRFYHVKDSSTNGQTKALSLGSKRKRILKDPATEQVTLLSHRNNIDLPLGDSLRRVVQERSKKDGTLPGWIREMIKGGETSVGETQGREMGYVVLIRSAMDVPKKGADPVYEELDPALALIDVLKGHTFAEFPTLEVVRKADWSAQGHEWEIEGGDDQSGDEDEEEQTEQRKTKRLKVDEETGKRLFGGLMGYGDPDDTESDDGNMGTAVKAETQPTSLLGALDYSSESSEASGSEDDIGGAPAQRLNPSALVGAATTDQEEVDWEDYIPE